MKGKPQHGAFMTQTEVAEALGWSVDTVKHYERMAKAKLKKSDAYRKLFYGYVLGENYETQTR